MSEFTAPMVYSAASPAPQEWPKQKTWSISAASNHAQCPLKYRFIRIDKLPVPVETDGPLVRGLDVHSKFDGYLKTGAWDFATGEFALWRPLLDSLRAVNAQSEIKAAFTQVWAPCGFFAPDVWFRGVFDVVVPPHAGNEWTVTVIDFKTGKRYDKHPLEARIYSLAALKMYPDARSALTQYWYVDEEPSKVPLVHAADRAAIIELERAADAMSHDVLNDTLYPARTGFHCRYCHFRKSNGGPCAFG
jgi:hypothetical protein